MFLLSEIQRKIKLNLVELRSDYILYTCNQNIEIQ